MILELLYEWEQQLPTAMASVESFGVPMRAPELAEMEVRRAYVNQAAQLIPEWAEANAASTYGGMVVDDRAGGVIHVGFTQNQAGRVADLKSALPLMAPNQVTTFTVAPVNSINSLRVTADSVADYLFGNGSTASATASVHMSDDSQAVEVEAYDVPAVSSAVVAQYGSGAPIKVGSAPLSSLALHRFAQSGPMLAGYAIAGAGGQCTAGFGARDNVNKRQGQPIYVHFTLASAHCFPFGSEVNRQRQHGPEDGALLGVVRRRESPGSGLEDDVEAIRLEHQVDHSGSVFFGNANVALPMRGAMIPSDRMEVCWSGSFGGVHCGKVLSYIRESSQGRQEKNVIVKGPAAQGDSGGPVWDPVTSRALGVIHAQADRPDGTLDGDGCHELDSGSRMCPYMMFDPLRNIGGTHHSPGALTTMDVELLKDW